jgi:predicted RNA-binding protein with PIN domain
MQRNTMPSDEARDRLIDLLEDYAGYTAQDVILVFDGHLGDRPTASIESRRLLTVIFTKHGQTADQYIERACGQIPSYREVRVATSDHLEQTLILGRGATRLSSRELWGELSAQRDHLRTNHVAQAVPAKTPLLGNLTKEQMHALEQIRRRKD